MDRRLKRGRGARRRGKAKLPTPKPSYPPTVSSAKVQPSAAGQKEEVKVQLDIVKVMNNHSVLATPPHSPTRMIPIQRVRKRMKKRRKILLTQHLSRSALQSLLKK